MEKGTYKLIDADTGQVVAMAVTRSDAIQKAVRFLEANPEVRNLTLEDGFWSEASQGPEISANAYYHLLGKLTESLTKEAKVLNKKLASEMVKRGLQGTVKIGPAYKWAAPLMKRKDVLMGEPNLFEIVFSYSYVLRKKIALDPLINEVRNSYRKYKDNPYGLKLLQDMISYAKGHYSATDKAVDKMIEWFSRTRVGNKLDLPIKPMAFTRGVGKIRSGWAKLKLGYRVVAAGINYVSGQGHIWTKVGFKYLLKAKQYEKTEAGRLFLASNSQYLGTSFGIEGVDGSGNIIVGTKEGKIKIKSKISIWKPLGMFSAAEVPNRRRSLIASYLYAKGELGMEEAEASEYARRGVRIQQFTYNVSALPLFLRGPWGKLVGQFRTYMVKELEFISQLRGKEIARYTAMQMALAGPLGIIHFLRTLPLIGLFIDWDDLEEWLTRKSPKLVQTMSRGMTGLLGGDITLPATFQFPHKADDWMGPFLSDMWKMYTKVYQPWAEGQGLIVDDFKNWALNLGPALNYWQQLVSSIYADDGYVTDFKTGNKMYKISSWWERIMLGMGVSPISRSDALFASRILLKEERVRDKTVQKLFTRLIKSIREGDVDEDVIFQLYQLGVRPQSIREAIRRKELPAEIRLVKGTRVRKRSRAIELLYPD